MSEFKNPANQLDVEAGVETMARMIEARDKARRDLARWCATMLGQEAPTDTILSVVDNGALLLVFNMMAVNPQITADEMRAFRVLLDKLAAR